MTPVVRPATNAVCDALLMISVEPDYCGDCAHHMLCHQGSFCAVCGCKAHVRYQRSAAFRALQLASYNLQTEIERLVPAGSGNWLDRLCGLLTRLIHPYR